MDDAEKKDGEPQCEPQCEQQREPQRRQQGKQRRGPQRAAIAVCALLLVVLVAGISLWSPWSAGQDQDQDGSDAAQGSASEIQDVTDAEQDSASEIQDVTDAEQEQSETGDEEDQSETGDSGTQAEDEEWPGQSLGYIGPNGEGALKDYDYDTIEEYTSLITDVFNGGWENYVERSYASDSDGEYVVGFLTVWFTCGEYDAHEIAEKHGAVWVSDYYMFMDGANDSVMVTLYFPDAQDRGDLKEIVEAITAEDGVKGANLLDDFGKLTPDG